MLFFTVTVISWQLVPDLLLVVVFGVFGLLGTYLSIYSLRWRAVVDCKKIKIFRSFLPVRSVLFFDIARIEFRNLVLWVIRKTARNLLQIIRRLDLIIFVMTYLKMGLYDRFLLKREFFRNSGSGRKMESYFQFDFFNVFFILAYLYDPEMTLLYIIIALILILLSVIAILKTFLWKITVSYQTLEIKAG